MKNFKCYNWESYIPDKECVTQCKDCERKQILELANATSPLLDDSIMEVPMAKYDGFDEDGTPLPGDYPDAIWDHKKVEEIKNSINNERYKERYNRNQLIMFAGYCLGKLMREPDRDIGEIVDEFRKEFYIK